MSEFEGQIGVYVDEKCTKKITAIGWSNGYVINLVDGTKEDFNNTAMAGELASAVIYLKNETVWVCGITDIVLPDKRLKYILGDKWIGMKPIKLIINYKVPANPTESDVIKDGPITIKAVFIYGRR